MIGAFDCSGLLGACLNVNGNPGFDDTADGYRNRCISIGENQLQPGDLTFEMSGSRATHVGIFIGGGKVIEARGRNYGVVETDLGSRNWSRYGRPDFMYSDEKAPQPQPTPAPKPETGTKWEANHTMYRPCHVAVNNYMNFRTGPGTGHSVIRRLYNGAKLAFLENCGNGWLNVYNIETQEQGYVSDQWIVFDGMMRGEDVRGLQRAINRLTGLGLAEDAALGDKTAYGIVQLQKSLGLKEDGQAGHDTVTAAGGQWTK